MKVVRVPTGALADMAASHNGRRISDTDLESLRGPHERGAMDEAVAMLAELRVTG